MLCNIAYCIMYVFTCLSIIFNSVRVRCQFCVLGPVWYGTVELYGGFYNAGGTWDFDH
jgi:hypothetical protein